MNLCPDERLLFVRMISAMLRRSGGDAGAVMFEAYRHIVSRYQSSSSFLHARPARKRQAGLCTGVDACRLHQICFPAEYDAENLLRSDAGLTVAGT